MGLELVSKDVIDENVSKQTPLKESKLEFNGAEHRLKVRRITAERRELIRFESTSDRRSGLERRIAHHLWDGREQ